MIISLSGKMFSGKSLVGKIIQYYIAASKEPDILSRELNDWGDDCAELSAISEFKLKSFAEKLKQIVCILLGCTLQDIEDRAFKESPLGDEWQVSEGMSEAARSATGEEMTPRKLMQLLGTDCGRSIIHPDIWINALFADYKSSDGHYPNWVITDSRFVNDDNALKSKGAIRIRIERPNIPVNDHSSETALDDVKDFDEIIQNDGSTTELMNKVKTILIRRNII